MFPLLMFIIVMIIILITTHFLPVRIFSGYTFFYSPGTQNEQIADFCELRALTDQQQREKNEQT